MHDWALPSQPREGLGYQLPKDLAHRLRIERLCNRITRTLYCDGDYKSGISEDGQYFGIVKLLGQELTQLEGELSIEGTSGKDIPMITTKLCLMQTAFTLLYLRCTELHLRLYTFFDRRTSNELIITSLSLYETCRHLLSMVLSPGLLSNDLLFGGDFLLYCPNYIFQMTLAAGFAVMKLLKSSLRSYIRIESGKTIFNSAILAIRRISITNNDLPGRLAEVLAQLWAKDHCMSKARPGRESSSERNQEIWEELHLKVGGRMSMSIVYDSLMEWRRGFEAEASRQTSRKIAPVASLDMPKGVDTNRSLSLAPASSLLQQAHAQEQVMESSPVRDNTTPSSAFAEQFNMSDIPYDNSFYPLNWILDGGGEIPNMPDNLAENV